MSYWHYRRSPASVGLLIELGGERGLSAAALLQGSALTADALHDPELEITAAQELRVVANLLRLTRGRLHGIDVGLRYHFSTYGLWGYGLISSATTADALQLALRYIDLTYAFTQITLHEEGDQAVLRFIEPALEPTLQRFVTERDLAAAAQLIRELAGPQFQLARWRTRRAAPRGRKAAALFGAAPQYGAAVDDIAFDRSWLQRSLPQANPITAALCDQLCRALIERYRIRADTSQLVLQQLERAQGALPDLPTMARALNASARTLKRRLHAEGSSYRQLLAERQRARAAELLRDPRLSLTQIAALLDFADVSSFSQAYKRWHGVAPSVARRTSSAARSG